MDLCPEDRAGLVKDPAGKLQATSLTTNPTCDRIKKSSIGFRTRWGW